MSRLQMLQRQNAGMANLTDILRAHNAAIAARGPVAPYQPSMGAGGLEGYAAGLANGGGAGGPCGIGAVEVKIFATGGTPAFLIQGLVTTNSPDGSPPFTVTFSAFLDAATDCTTLDVTLPCTTIINHYYDTSSATLRVYAP